MNIIEEYKTNLRHRELKDGSNISYLDIGSGNPLIFLPSWPSSGMEYLPLINILKEKYRCICINLPGWLGDSSSKREPDFNNFFSIIKLFIDSLDLNNFSIVGYSLGSVLARELGEFYEKKVDSIILISPVRKIDDLIQSRRFFFYFYKFFRHILPNSFFSILISKISRSTTVNKPYYKENKEFLDFNYDQIRKSNVKRLIESLLSFEVADYDIENSNPVNIIYADNDSKFVLNSVPQFQKIRVKEVKDADHNHVVFFPIHSARFIEEVVR